MPEATVMVADHKVLTGKTKAGKDWKLTKLVDGNGEEYGTFTDSLASQIISLKGKKATISWEEKDGKNNLQSAQEFFESKRGGGGYDDPVRQHRITVLACMKVASEIVNHAADLGGEEAGPFDSEMRVRAVKRYAAELAVWVDEYAERAANPPFSDAVEDDGIPFGEPEGG